MCVCDDDDDDDDDDGWMNGLGLLLMVVFCVALFYI